MNTKTMLVMLERNEFDAEEVCKELLRDAESLVQARRAKENTAVRACYTEQLQKYDSAIRKYAEKNKGANVAHHDPELMRNLFSRDQRVAAIIGAQDRVERRYSEAAEALKLAIKSREALITGLSVRFEAIREMHVSGDKDIERAVDEMLLKSPINSTNAAISLLAVSVLVRDISKSVSDSVPFIGDADWNEYTRDFTNMLLKGDHSKLTAVGFSTLALVEGWLSENFNMCYKRIKSEQSKSMLAALHMLGSTVLEGKAG
jgi:hypothetical protein